MKALILAAGYATRLYPLTKSFPKPLLEVGARPIINYILEKLERLGGIDEIIVVTNSKFYGRFKRWASGLKSTKPITVMDDLTLSHQDRRGAIGDMHFVISRRRLKCDLLVVGGDNLFDAELNGFLSFAREKNSPLIGVYDIGQRKKATQYGVVKLGAGKRVIGFQEKPKEPLSALVAMCLYYFPAERLGLIKEYLGQRRNKHDATGLYIDWLKDKIEVYAYVFKGRWYDIGHHDFYREAKSRFR